jgi:hypothetical protein
MVRLFGVDPAEDRFRIRALRATPPGRAARSGERRRVFTSALEQFDQLLDAAGAVGPASRPLPLYYAVSQATTAIAAALVQTDRPWRPGSHGLVVGEPDRKWLGQTQVRTQPATGKKKPCPDDSFSILCDVLRRPTFTRPTTLAGLWAATPGLDEPGLGGGHVRALPLEFHIGAPFADYAILRHQRVVASDAGMARVKEMLKQNFPAYKQGLIVEEILPEPNTINVSRVHIRWVSPDGVPRDVRMVATEYLRGFWLIPCINSRGETLPPLLLWWALLYALSDVARYHPAEWMGALDPNKAREAVPIERALEQALAVIPRLVLTTLVPGAYGRG